MKSYFLIFTVLLTWLSASTAYGQNQSHYLSFDDNNICHKPSTTVSQYYVDVRLVQCSIKDNSLQVILVSTDEHSWLDFVVDGYLWSSEDEIVYRKENQFGNFANVGTTPLEIRTNGSEIIGLIFRVTAQSESSIASDIARLFVLRVDKVSVCFAGVTLDNIAARKLVDDYAPCRRLQARRYRLTASKSKAF